MLAFVVGIVSLVTVLAPTGVSAASCDSQGLSAPVIKQKLYSRSIVWENVPCATNYNIHKKDGSFVASVQTKEYASSKEGTTYFVTATRGSRISARSNNLTVGPKPGCSTTPKKPTGLTQRSKDGSTAFLEWDFDPCADWTRVYRLNKNGTSDLLHFNAGGYRTTVPKGATYYLKSQRGRKVSWGSATIDIK